MIFKIGALIGVGKLKWTKTVKRHKIRLELSAFTIVVHLKGDWALILSGLKSIHGVLIGVGKSNGKNAVYSGKKPYKIRLEMSEVTLEHLMW